jgi:hypothetical protein
MAASRNPTTAARPSLGGMFFVFAWRFMCSAALAAAAPPEPGVGVESADMRNPQHFLFKPKPILFKPKRTQRKPKQT